MIESEVTSAGGGCNGLILFQKGKILFLNGKPGEA
jgi:hypothetical protein